MKSLGEISNDCTRVLLEVLEKGGYGHAGGSLSSLHALVALYFKVARLDPTNPLWEDRDRIIISKAHIVEAVYAVLIERGFVDRKELDTYLQPTARLQGHAERSTPGIEYSGGSLGQGLSFANGVALVGKMRQKDYKVYCLVGDSECHEGQVWEAAMFASHYGLDNLYAIVDYNKYGDHDETNKMMNLEPLTQKWAAFGWECLSEPSGNNVDKVVSALNLLSNSGEKKPKCLILNTTKGIGVPTWEESHSHIVAGSDMAHGIAQWREAADATR